MLQVSQPMKRCVVLGRFQPFHLGHASLVEAAAEHAVAERLWWLLARLKPAGKPTTRGQPRNEEP